MEHHNISKHWTSTQKLRRPYPATTAAPVNEMPAVPLTNSQQIIKKSTTAAPVSEVPAVSLTNSQKIIKKSTTVDDNILLKTTLNVAAKEFIPRNNLVTSTFTNSMPPQEPSKIQKRLLQFKERKNEEVDCENQFFKDYNQIKVIIETLINDPGQYDYLVTTFTNILSNYSTDLHAITDITKLVFNYVLLEQNFIYTAARLLRTVGDEYPLFKPELHTLCQRNMSNSCESNLLLFVGELYSQYGKGDIYSENVIRGINFILIEETKIDINLENIKTVCQTLKLTGALLEKDHKEELNGILCKLNSMRTQLPSSIISLINLVTNLRDQKWGQEATQTSLEVNQVQNYVDEPVFYGPDGFELNDEERQFLAENCSFNIDQENYPSECEEMYELNPEMDAEAQEAYREFLLNK